MSGVGFRLKEDATSTSLAVHVVKIELADGVFIVGVEETFLGEPKEKVRQTRSFHYLVMPRLPMWH